MPIGAACNQMMVQGETGGHITRFVPEQYYLKDFSTVQEEIKHLFINSKDIDAAGGYITARQRDLERIMTITNGLQDACTELSLYFEAETIEECYAEHYYAREAHREAIDARESTHESVLKKTKEEEAKEKDGKKKEKMKEKISAVEPTVACAQSKLELNLSAGGFEPIVVTKKYPDMISVSF